MHTKVTKIRVTAWAACRIAYRHNLGNPGNNAVMQT